VLYVYIAGGKINACSEIAITDQLHIAPHDPDLTKLTMTVFDVISTYRYNDDENVRWQIPHWLLAVAVVTSPD